MYRHRRPYYTFIHTGTALGGFDDCTNYSRFTVEIGLTDAGFEKYRDVLVLLFQYIAMMRDNLPCERLPNVEGGLEHNNMFPRLYEECKKMYQIDFDFMEEEEPYDNVENLSENMLLYPAEHYISGPELFYEHQPDLVTSLLNDMNPHTMLLTLQSKTYQKECKSQEQWYRGNYKKDKLEEQFLDTLASQTGGSFNLPEPNPYIPEDFEIKELDVDQTVQAPVLIADEKAHKLWYYVDEVFEKPECLMYWQVYW
eukprot:sb/3468633/